MTRPAFPLIDGPLMAMPTPNAALILKMAADLRRLGVTSNERDAIRTLTTHPCCYRMGDVALLAEEALFEAQQAPVTRKTARR